MEEQSGSRDGADSTTESVSIIERSIMAGKAIGAHSGQIGGHKLRDEEQIPESSDGKVRMRISKWFLFLLVVGCLLVQSQEGSAQPS